MNIRNLWIGSAMLLLLAAGGAAAADADPEDGKISDGAYRNPYFGLTYPLPPGWSAGLDPARPSNNGYYVLNTPQGPDKTSPTLLFAAQDMFFAFKPAASAMAQATDLQHATQRMEGMKADTPPAQVTVAGRSFARLPITGAILSRIFLATDIRCHIVTITIASPDPAQLDKLAASFEAMTLPPEASATTDGSADAGSSFPVCIKDYATEQTLVHRVQPSLEGPKFVKMPVRIIIGKDGKVKHVHVIRAPEGSKKLIEDAVAQWVFKPYEVKGQPVEVETGLVFENN
jgi:hypothetical protein